jgi:hypothetical protein
LDVCSYQIRIPSDVYNEPKIVVRFNKLNGLKAYINSGSNFKNAQGVLVKNNAEVVENA